MVDLAIAPTYRAGSQDRAGIRQVDWAGRPQRHRGREKREPRVPKQRGRFRAKIPVSVENWRGDNK